MHCLRHLAILSILVPMPSASPFLLLLVAMVAYMAVKPCGYCLATLAVVFFSTSPSSPFLAALAPEPPVLTPSPQVSPPEPIPLSAPIADRGAFFLNGGRFFDPALVGYTEMQRAWTDDVPAHAPPPAQEVTAVAVDSDNNAPDASKHEPNSEAPPPPVEEAQTSTTVRHSSSWLSGWMSPFKRTGSPDQAPRIHPPTPPIRALPRGYYDLRLGGVGLVLDLGWRRTDEGLAWELEEQKHAAELQRYRRAERQRRQGVASDRDQSLPAKSATGSGWMRASFVDSW